jgi:hypothetical protein
MSRSRWRQDARAPDRGFLCPGKLREDNLMVHDLMLVQVETGRVQISVGLLHDPGEFPAKRRSAARSGLFDGEKEK